MKNSKLRCAISALFGVMLTGIALGATETIPREEVRLHFKVLRRLDPKVGDLFRKLVLKYSDKPAYTVEEVQAIVAPKAKTEPRASRFTK